MRQLEAFRAAMVLGGITRAAEAMGISQPAASRLLLDLSAEVGYPLFDRDGAGSVPTKNAEALFTEIDRLFTGMDALRSRADAIGKGKLGNIDIVASSIHANGVLPPIVAAFLARHPGTTVTIEAQPYQHIADWVSARRCEIGFTNLPVTAPALKSHRLAAHAADCIMSTASAMTKKTVIRAADLNGQPFVTYPRGSMFRFQIDAAFERADCLPLVVAEARTHEAICGLVAEGVGLAIVSPFSNFVAGNARLTSRPFAPAIPIEIGLLVESKLLSTQAQLFVDFVIDWFARSAPQQCDVPAMAAEAPVPSRTRRSRVKV
jgi:DNA-binding transcriptional LysR family regulator